MSLEGHSAVVRRPAWIPGWRIAQALLLALALAISIAAGRVIEAAIIAVLLLPALALVGLWVVAWRRDELANDR
jgi:hypothetical protein